MSEAFADGDSQYYDPETDLFENWHRYYDANTGRYLEPDVIWRYPNEVLKDFGSGMVDAVYAYAGNDPLVASDPSGETIKETGDGANAAGAAVDACLQAEGPAGDECRKMHTSDQLFVVLEDSRLDMGHIHRVLSAGGTPSDACASGACSVQVSKDLVPK